jgi:hypothetical protein
MRKIECIEINHPVALLDDLRFKIQVRRESIQQ